MEIKKNTAKHCPAVMARLLLGNKALKPKFWDKFSSIFNQLYLNWFHFI